MLFRRVSDLCCLFVVFVSSPGTHTTRRLLACVGVYCSFHNFDGPVWVPDKRVLLLLKWLKLFLLLSFFSSPFDVLLFISLRLQRHRQTKGNEGKKICWMCNHCGAYTTTLTPTCTTQIASQHTFVSFKEFNFSCNERSLSLVILGPFHVVHDMKRLRHDSDWCCCDNTQLQRDFSETFVWPSVDERERLSSRIMFHSNPSWSHKFVDTISTVQFTENYKFTWVE